MRRRPQSRSSRYRSPEHFLKVLNTYYGPMLKAFAALDEARRGDLTAKRHANLAEEAAHHRGVGFDPSLARKAIAQSLNRDIRFLGPPILQEFPMRHQRASAMAAICDRLSGAMALDAFEPLDGHRFADRAMTRPPPAGSSCGPHRADHSNISTACRALP